MQFAGDTAFAAWAGVTGMFAAVGHGGGAFGKPQRLSSLDLENQNVTPLAVDDRGDAVAAWVDDNPGGPFPNKPGPDPESLFLSYRHAGGRFGPGHVVTKNAGGAAIAMDASGDATIAWTVVNSHRKLIAVGAVERQANGHYGRVQRLTREAAGQVAVAVNARDQAVIAWQSSVFPDAAIRASTRDVHGRFTRPIQLVSSKQGAADPTVGIDDAALATIAWEGPSDDASMGNPFRGIEAVSLNVGAHKPSPIQRLTSAAPGELSDTATPQLGVDAGGDAILSWIIENGTGARIVVARARAEKPFGTEFADFPVVAIGPRNQAIVVWEDTGPISAAAPPTPTRLLYATTR